MPRWIILLMDMSIVFLSAIFSYWVVNQTLMIAAHHWEVLCTAAMFALLSLVGTRMFKTYAGVLRHSNSVDMLKLTYADLTNLIVALAFSQAMRWMGVSLLCAFRPLEILLTFMITMLLLWASRLLIRILYDATRLNENVMRALVYGDSIDEVGMAKYIRSQPKIRFDLAGFISHEHSMKNMKLMGLDVYMSDDDIAEVVSRNRVKAMLVGYPRMDEFRHDQKFQDVLLELGVKIFMVKYNLQDFDNIGTQDSTSSVGADEGVSLHEVNIEDLLPRQEISINMLPIKEMLTGRRVMVTGSAGSIGREIVRQVAQFKPDVMLLIDQAETPQHDVRIMMDRDFPDVKYMAVVTNIDRRTRMEHIFEQFRPEYVFHAAAYKHVPMMEDNPSEAVLNNIHGTKIIADMSVKYGVKKFVMISTDKAVNPTNVMGCSKRICEIYVQSLDKKLKREAMLNNDARNCTQFVTTRFGNVLGSNGSVIPLFREQIKNGGPVTVTDERVVRFFMLIPEACKLVLEAGTIGSGGEIFVFDMGHPVRITDLAKRMIALSGAKNIEIKYTGLREGEKLYEEVLNEQEHIKPTSHEKIRIAEVREYDYDEVARDIDDLIDIAKRFVNMETVKKMKEIVPEYKSNNSVYEVLDK